MAYKQEPPYAVQVELTEGCNLRCGFCALNGIRGKENNFKFADRAMIKSLFKQMSKLGWNPRVEFAMHGEPTMHPEYHELIKTARQAAPRLQLMMTSNGGGLLKAPGARENIMALFDAGLNVLALDDYEGIRICEKVRSKLADEPIDGVKIYEYPTDKDGNPHARRSLASKSIILIQDISQATKGTHSNLTNQGGTAAPPDKSMHGKRCAKPFRELSVRWDGNVAICCDDWRGVYKCGNVVTDGLEEVWNGAPFRAARRFLYQGDRAGLNPCKGCNVRSYRTGLLPDKYGKVSLKAPTSADQETARSAMSGDPYTAPVLRAWEKK